MRKSSRWALVEAGPADDQELLCFLPGKAPLWRCCPGPVRGMQEPGPFSGARKNVAGWEAPVGGPGWSGESLGAVGRGQRIAAPAGSQPRGKPQSPTPGLPTSNPPTPARELSPPARYGSESRDQGQHGRRRCWELRCRRRRAAGGNPPASPPLPAGLLRSPERRRLGLGRHRAAAAGSR